MTLPAAQVSAPGLTEDQIQAELTWLEGFAHGSESLDWTKWEGFWAKDAFLQFGNLPRIQGKEAIASSHGLMFGAFEYLSHDWTRFSFDVPLGLIYQTCTVTYRVKGDPEKRDLRFPGLSVVHKKIGETQATGLEIYVDSSPVMSVVQEVLSRKAANN
ncbi:unnamed protein product [Rhizoctonia solani]|uniref:SnoaL-like domain-containing protein n=1 Tax=Rhizoctonia solani TaxID=456999 RepID=A0A8H3GFC7_9AGAM